MAQEFLLPAFDQFEGEIEFHHHLCDLQGCRWVAALRVSAGTNLVYRADYYDLIGRNGSGSERLRAKRVSGVA
jgi:hypothetical protein